MKAKLLSGGTLICLAVLACLFLVNALSIYPGVDAMRWFFRTSAVVLSRLDAPAWAQAGTAAVAIAAGAIAVVWQQRQQADAMRMDQIRRLKILSGALFNCRVIVEYLQHGIELAGVPADGELADLRSQLDGLQRLAPFDYPNWPAFHAVESATRTFRMHEASILSASRVLSTRSWDERTRLLEKVHYAFREAERMVGDFVLDLKGELTHARYEFANGHVVYTYGHPMQPKGA